MAEYGLTINVYHLTTILKSHSLPYLSSHSFDILCSVGAYAIQALYG